MWLRSVTRRTHRPSRLAAASCVFSCLFALGCSDSGDDGSSTTGITVNATISDTIETVAKVTWTTGEAAKGHVEFGTTTALGSETSGTESAATEHSELLLGLTADTLYYYQVVTDDGEKSDIKSIRTGYLPPAAPEMTLVGSGHDQFVMTTVLGMNNAAMVVNPEGQIVWYLKDESELQLIRARLSRDGKSVLYNRTRASGDPSADSQIVRVSLDGSPISSVTVPYLAHDFVELPDGTIAAVVVDQTTVDGADVKSNSIVEVDSEGTVTEVWSALDCFDPAVDESSEPEQGWTLANALDYDDTDDVYYFGSRGLSSIARIPRGGRDCEWVLGSSGSTIDFAEGSTPFLHQHQFQVFGDHVILHDNDGLMNHQSRIAEYSVDFEAGTATEIWSYQSNPPVYTPVLGEAVMLEGGDRFVDWSYAGQLERVTAQGESVWKLNTKVGAVLGYITLFKSFY